MRQAKITKMFVYSKIRTSNRQIKRIRVTPYLLNRHDLVRMRLLKSPFYLYKIGGQIYDVSNENRTLGCMDI